MSENARQWYANMSFLNVGTQVMPNLFEPIVPRPSNSSAVPCSSAFEETAARGASLCESFHFRHPPGYFYFSAFPTSAEPCSSFRIVTLTLRFPTTSFTSDVRFLSCFKYHHGKTMQTTSYSLLVCGSKRSGRAWDSGTLKGSPVGRSAITRDNSHSISKTWSLP